MIADRLTFYRAQNIVVDPVMVSTSGAKLIGEDAIEVLKAELFPLAALLTPNIPEAEVCPAVRSGLKKRWKKRQRSFPKRMTAGCF